MIFEDDQEDEYVKKIKQKQAKKKIVIGGMFLCLILIILIIVLIVYIKFQDSKTLKLYINGAEKEISTSLFQEIDEESYINVKEIASMLGYSYKKGDYLKYNENENSCYLESDYEIVSFSESNDYFIKYTKVPDDAKILDYEVTIKLEEGQKQEYSIKSPIQFVNGALYIPFDCLTDMFNIYVNTSEENKIYIYGLEKVVSSYLSKISNAGYKSFNTDYENLKAMLYGVAVVGDGTHYGVINLSSGEEVIGTKYKDITFLCNTRDFIVKAENTVGIVNTEGKTIIKPSEYDNISVYDELQQLYLVEKDKKYGIISKSGEIAVYSDYDEIGYDFQNVEYNLFFDETIPVKTETGYGLCDLEGNVLLQPVYTFGCIPENTNIEKPVLTIPESVGIKGVVIYQNDFYGIYDVESENLVIPCVCTKIYSKTKSNETSYYIVYSGQEINLEEYIESNDLATVTDKN